MKVPPSTMKAGENCRALNVGKMLAKKFLFYSVKGFDCSGKKEILG